MLDLQEISVSVPDGRAMRTVLRDLCLTVSAGSAVAIVGPSGAGKSTLLEVAAGIRTVSHGRVRRSNGDELCLVHQELLLVPFLTGEENVRLAVEVAGVEPAACDVDELFCQLGIDDVRHVKPGRMSKGEQQRVAIARVLAGSGQLLLADEPTAALDAQNSAVVADLLHSIAGRNNVAVVVATHDPIVSAKMDVVYRLEAGRLWRESE